ncbi:nuclear transport factor 2 family protein [Pseudonocardia acaciae]|uniref:nuclear transport factor 2 family protein n=1 Tax=Pseudonocardia acaciae TaxID=551276 RepID=UPI0007E8D584|nr:nuclear transport factor 2 family protein [Pseudonocardia acaciae]
MNGDKTLWVLDEFTRAWNRGDLDAMMSHIAEDCVFLASAGPELDGEAFRGRAAVREGFAGLLAAFPGSSYERTDAIVDGGRAFIGWTLSYTGPDGRRVRVRGCDLFEVEDGRIRRKDGFRKQLRTER